MKLQVKEVKSPLEEGKHTGVITKIEYRHEPFEYTDIYIKVDDSDMELKYGCPTTVSTESKLGKLLMTVGGVELTPGEEVDLEKALIGKKVKFVTFNEKGKNSDREFARISEGSVKPIN